MKMIELENAYSKNQIEKKLYWSLMREKTATLKEIQDLIEIHTVVKKIEIENTGILLERTDGIKIYFDFNQTICRAEIILYLAGNPEDDDINFISEILPKSAVIFDVGANIGLISMMLQKRHQDAKFYAFEPVLPTFEKMKKNIELNNLLQNICLFNIGFSDKCENTEFYLPGTDEAASMQPVDDNFYLKKSLETGEITPKETMQKIWCTVTKIDTFIKENKIEKLDFIKIDTEGNEKFVLGGGEKTLLQLKPIVYSELLRKHCARFHYSPNEVITFMSELDYSCFILENKKLIKFIKMDENTLATNFLFLHNKKHFSIIEKYNN